MFSVDYPFSSNAIGRKFLDSLAISPKDMEKITHRNAEQLLKTMRDSHRGTLAGLDPNTVVYGILSSACTRW